MNFIPTRRPQDEAVKGVGKIVSVEGNILRGEDTMFIKSLGEKFTVWLTKTKKSFVVSRVIDNQTVQIENPDNESLVGINEEFTIIPKLDQKEVFGHSWNLLKEGKVVGIFPEVKSKL